MDPSLDVHYIIQGFFAAGCNIILSLSLSQAIVSDDKKIFFFFFICLYMVGEKLTVERGISSVSLWGHQKGSTGSVQRHDGVMKIRFFFSSWPIFIYTFVPVTHLVAAVLFLPPNPCVTSVSIFFSVNWPSISMINFFKKLGEFRALTDSNPFDKHLFLE